MIKSLVRHEGEWALVFDQQLLDSISIAPDTPLEIGSDGQSLTIRPMISPDSRTTRDDKLDAILVDVNQRFGNALRKLAE